MIHVVIGAPCAGKSTYVRENAKKGDVIVDYDEIARAIGADGHLPDGAIKDAAFTARDSLIGWALDNADAESWVIHTSPGEEKTAEYKAAGAEFITLDTDMDTCIERCRNDGRPDGTEDVIRAYYAGTQQQDGRKDTPMRHKSFDFKVKGADIGTGRPSIVAYASTFDREPDSYGDVVAKGAFAKWIDGIRESGEKVPLLFGHRTDDPFMNIGVVTDVEEDGRGLRVCADFDMDNPNGEYARKLVMEGRLSKLSFAYEVVDERPVTLEGGVKANELRELNVFEVSLVPIPANRHAEVISAKSDAPDGGVEPRLDGIGELVDELASRIAGIQEVIRGANAADDGGEGTPGDKDEANPTGEEPKSEDSRDGERLATLIGIELTD